MKHLILYDGVCGLCNRLVQFVLKNDRSDQFRFAALQSSISADLLLRYKCNPSALDTMYVIVNYKTATEQVISKGQAMIFVLKNLGRFWTLMGIFEFLPKAVLDFVYQFIAKRRYRWFGSYDQCPLPDPKFRLKFIEEKAC